MRNTLTNSPLPAGATIDTGGTVDLITLGTNLSLAGSVLNATGGGAAGDYFIIDGGSASTTYPSNSLRVDFGAAS